MQWAAWIYSSLSSGQLIAGIGGGAAAAHDLGRSTRVCVRGPIRDRRKAAAATAEMVTHSSTSRFD